MTNDEKTTGQNEEEQEPQSTSETEGTEETAKQPETVGKTRVKVSDEDKHIADKDFVICPLVLKISGGRSAVNYDLTWLSTTSIKEGVVGCWRSAPQQRGHSDAFYAELDKMKEEGKAPKDWGGFYFTDEQGRAARLKYEMFVLTGRVKANKKSWTNRFERFTGVSFEDLMDGKHLTEEDGEIYANASQERSFELEDFESLEQAESKFKSLYSATTPRKAKEIIEGEKPTLDESALHVADDLLEEIEPEDAAIEAIHYEESDTQAEAEDQEEAIEVAEVAATTLAESDIAGVETLRPEQEFEEVEFNIGPFDEFQELNSDAFHIRDGGRDWKLYLVELPHNEMICCLPAGRHLIDGYVYNIQVEGMEEDEAKDKKEVEAES